MERVRPGIAPHEVVARATVDVIVAVAAVQEVVAAVAADRVVGAETVNLVSLAVAGERSGLDSPDDPTPCRPRIRCGRWRGAGSTPSRPM